MGGFLRAYLRVLLAYLCYGVTYLCNGASVGKGPS